MVKENFEPKGEKFDRINDDENRNAILSSSIEHISDDLDLRDHPSWKIIFDLGDTICKMYKRVHRDNEKPHCDHQAETRKVWKKYKKYKSQYKKYKQRVSKKEQQRDCKCDKTNYSPVEVRPDDNTSFISD